MEDFYLYANFEPIRNLARTVSITLSYSYPNMSFMFDDHGLYIYMKSLGTPVCNFNFDVLFTGELSLQSNK